MHNDYIYETEKLLDYLQENEPIEAIETTLERINYLINKHDNVANFVSNNYFSYIFDDGKTKKRFLIKICHLLKEGVYLGLALCISRSLIQAYRQDGERWLINQLISIVIDYRISDYVEISINNTTFKMAMRNYTSILFSYEDMDDDYKPDMLYFALRAIFYRNETLEGHFIDQYQKFQSVNHILRLLYSLNWSLKRSKSYMEPFILDNLSYTMDSAMKLFEEDLSYSEYEKRMLEVYDIPLLPLIENASSEFSINGAKIGIQNTGYGYLPASSVLFIVEDMEIEVGDLKTDVPPKEFSEVFIEDIKALYAFIAKVKKSSTIRIVFRFRKFGYSYQMNVLETVAGKVLEKLSSFSYDTATLHELPLIKLGDKEFERLCSWVVAEATNNRFTKVLWLNEDGGGERGRDVLATEVSTGKSYVFQCKCVEKFHPSDIEKELNTFNEYILSYPEIKPDVYVIFVSASITDKTKASGDKMAEQMNMEIEYWPKSNIERMVRNNSSIVARFWRIVSYIH